MIFRKKDKDSKENEELEETRRRLDVLLRELRLIEARRNIWKLKSS